jgi:hypothetical protein
MGYEREKLAGISASILDVDDEVDDSLKFLDIITACLETHQKSGDIEDLIRMMEKEISG